MTGILPAQEASITPRHDDVGSLSDLKLFQLEQHLAEIDADLSQLAQASLRGGVGSIGYRSRTHADSATMEWIEIELESEVPIDEIVLVPTLWRDSEKGFQSDGFPESFRVLAKSGGSPDGTVLAAYDDTSRILPRIAPLVILAGGISASHIRIEATRLSPRAFDKQFIFQLSELLVFSGEKNIALRRPVNCPAPPKHTRPDIPWDKQFLVDGHTPYLMDAATGEKSLPFLNHPTAPSVLTVDLEASLPVSGIHLHAVDQSDTVPQAYAGNYGIPRHLKIVGANIADFSDTVTLLETRIESINDTGPIMMWNVPETRCRYVRLTEANPAEGFRIGFAEIELLSEHQNVALGKSISNPGARIPYRPLDTLTDGRNLYGNILPIRIWMNQLARRHDLETKRPRVMQELALRYERQKKKLRRMSWLAALLVAGSAIIILAQQIIRRRAIVQTRERIAANLHDELGANLHAIGLLGDFAKKIVERKNATDEWDDLTEVIDEVRVLTEETGETARYCTNMLETKEIHANLIEEMKRTADRLLSDLEYETSFPDPKSLQHLKPRRRVDLYLFYKECLTNILRHSNATRVSTELTATERGVNLIIKDNGAGLSGQEVPASLRRRARLFGGSVAVENLTDGGTQITLSLRPRKFLWFN